MSNKQSYFAICTEVRADGTPEYGRLGVWGAMAADVDHYRTLFTGPKWREVSRLRYQFHPLISWWSKMARRISGSWSHTFKFR